MRVRSLKEQGWVVKCEWELWALKGGPSVASKSVWFLEVFLTPKLVVPQCRNSRTYEDSGVPGLGKWVEVGLLELMTT